MKAVVVEIKNNMAAVLSDNGCVVTVKNNGYEIGQVIQMRDSRNQLTKKIAVLAASAAAVCLLGTGAWAYATPYSYVSVDVNPSIEYTINRFDRVLSVKAVNDDGEEILQNIELDNLENQTITAAILQTVEQISAAGYFGETTENGGIVITTASKDTDKADELAADLQEAVTEEITEAKEDVIVEAYSVGLERVEEAKEFGVTPGKLNLVEKLQSSASDPNAFDINEWLNRPVKDIMKATKDNRKASSVSGSSIAIDEKSTDIAVKKEAKEEKRQEHEEQKQIKEEEKQQKKDQDKQQKDQSEQQKDQSEPQKDQKQQKADQNKQQPKEPKQVEEKHPPKDSSLKKPEEKPKDTKAADKDVVSDQKDQENSDNKKDKSTNPSDQANDVSDSDSSPQETEPSISEPVVPDTDITDDSTNDSTKDNNGSSNQNNGSNNNGSGNSGNSGGRK